jgi:hypothetical protein
VNPFERVVLCWCLAMAVIVGLFFAAVVLTKLADLAAAAFRPCTCRTCTTARDHLTCETLWHLPTAEEVRR